MDENALRSVDEVCAVLCTSVPRGLTEDEVHARLAKYGFNELPVEQTTSLSRLVLDQFDDLLVRILLAAALASFVLTLCDGDVAGLVEPLIIVLILTLNAIVGVWQQRRAESAIEALHQLVPTHAVVVRNATQRTIDARYLVPGDVVRVSVGDRVPADMRVACLDSTTLRVDQSILNGESEEALKQVEASVACDERFAASMLYSGTAVVYGSARCVVVRTGVTTEIGQIERSVRAQKEERTPLQVKLDEFGVLLSKAIGCICVVVFMVDFMQWYMLQHRLGGRVSAAHLARPMIHSVKLAVALAVAAIPEGLPAVVTTCLALGTRRMARYNAYVRDLPSVETLGRCTVICSDKTGTLTTNRMLVRRVVTLDSEAAPRVYTLHESSTDYVTCGGELVHCATEEDMALSMIARVAVLCNDAALHVVHDAHGTHVTKSGESTEAALLLMAEKLAAAASTNVCQDIARHRREEECRWHTDAALEFTRERKSMSVLCTDRHAVPMTHMLFVKGAPEELLRRSTHVLLSDGSVMTLSRAQRCTIVTQLLQMTTSVDALRCMAFAYRAAPAHDELQLFDPHNFAQVESELTFAGVCGMLDPPRDEVRGAVAQCRQAGIRVIVITGDKKETAESVCRQIGLLDAAPSPDVSFTGADFDCMSATEKRRAALSVVVFSRTDASHKMQLVTLLQQHRFICAMTGDGVNDSPALKKADIGIAIGSGTDVAKNASKMILADDNFATLVAAVREGRRIFGNTRQFIRYLISSNIGEVVCVLLAGVLGLPSVLTPIQLLWVNLVTDGLPATALGFNPAEPDVMHTPPRSADEPIVNRRMFLRYVVVGLYVGVATTAGYVWSFLAHGYTWTDITHLAVCTNAQSGSCAAQVNTSTAQSVALSILVVVEMLNALNALSEHHSLLTLRPSSNPWLLLAIASSIALHLCIMYVPFLAALFGIAPLGVDADRVRLAHPWTVVTPSGFDEWRAVLVFSMPVLAIDELLKLVSRSRATMTLYTVDSDKS